MKSIAILMHSGSWNDESPFSSVGCKGFLSVAAAHSVFMPRKKGISTPRDPYVMKGMARHGGKSASPNSVPNKGGRDSYGKRKL